MQNTDYNNKERLMSKRIPIHGNMSRPADPADAIQEVEKGKVEWTGGDLIVSVSTQEFTSVCPTTGQPDFNTISIIYKPDRFYVESKTMKFYLWSYREYGAHCETLAKKIAEDIYLAIEPLSIEVIVNQFPRGGLKIISNFKKER